MRRSCDRSRSSCSTSSTRCLARSPAAEPEGFEEILAAADPGRAGAKPATCPAGSPARGSAARPGCVLGKPVENIPRAGIRAIARGDGQLAGRAAGSRPRACRRRSPSAGRGTAPAARRASPRTSTGSRRTTTSTSRCSASRCSSAAAPASTRSTSPRSGSTTCRPAGSSPPSGSPMRNLLEAYLPPETATRRNPFREWIGARLRVDAYGWAAARRPGRRGADGVGGRARQPHGERRLRGDVHGRGARGLGRRVVAGGVRRRRPLGRSGREQARRGAADGARARRCSSTGRRRSTSSTPRYDDYHWVHAINNTALVAAALYAFDDDFSGAICGGRPGRLGHRHERRRGRLDRRRGRRGRRDRGALVGAARRPLRELAARASTGSRSTSSSRRTLAVAGAPAAA